MSGVVEKIHTACKNCVFAVYDGITQTDCALGYLSTLRNNNKEILEAYDNEKEFFIVNNKKCIGYTEKKHLKKNNLDNASLDTIIAEFHNRNKLNYLLVIDTKTISFSDVRSILDNIKKLDVLPQKIIIIRYPDTNNIIDFDSIKAILDSIKLPWKIMSSQEKDYDYLFFINQIVYTESKYKFIYSINGFTEAKDINLLPSQANDIVHNKLDEFVFLKRKNANNFIFPVAIYKYFKLNGDNLLKLTDYHTEI